MKLHELTIAQAHQGLIKKEFSALELTQVFLERIKELDKKFLSFLTISEKLAILQAKAVDEKISRRDKSLLHPSLCSGSRSQEIPFLAGIPLAVKDNILVKDLRSTAGSKILEDYKAPYDATVIKKIKEQGGVILGKTNLDEFAMGSSGEFSAFGPTRNPCDLERVPGGSSSGSAAAVGAGLSLYALGSDTGGSIRQPASFCGVVGLKPTYGAVSRFGLIAMASSLDQIGPITKTVEDAEIVFEAIRKQDPLDSTSVESKVSSFKSQVAGLKIGIPKEYFIKGINPKVEKSIKEGIKKIEDSGAKIEEISLPHTEYALPCYYIIMSSEASANLARYDGIKYGFSKTKNQKPKIEFPSMEAKVKKRTKLSSPVKSLLDVYLKSRGEGFGEEVRRRIMLGTYALSAGYYEAYYLKAQKVRSKIKEDFEKAFEKVDLILTPVSPTLPFKIGEKIKDPLLMYLSDVFTVSVNLAALPAMSIPCGRVDDLPVGLQIIGKPFEEGKIFQAGKIFEK